MTKIYWEEKLFPQFLQSLDSATLSDFANDEIQNQISLLAERAIADFKFPRVDLSYEFDESTNSETGIPYGYYFTDEEISQKEYNVIVARMKQFWVQYQLSQEKLFQNMYYDKHIRIHSPGNTIHNLDKLWKSFKKEADKQEYDYYRVNKDGSAKWGTINE